MKGEKREQWMSLCEQAAEEQDPEKLMALVNEITRLLDEKRNRLIANNAEAQPTISDR
jgi:hypothetical protein